jgi:hypothetical protein
MASTCACATSTGTAIYVPGVTNSPTSSTVNQSRGIDSFATSVFQNDPRNHTQFHILLLDHVVNDGLVSADTLLSTPANRYGNDYIAGGGGEDEIFGQLATTSSRGTARSAWARRCRRASAMPTTCPPRS